MHLMMKRMLILLTVLCLTLLASMATTLAAGKQDIRIAVLPLRVAENVELAPGAYKKLEEAFQKSVDEVVKNHRSFIAYIPKDESRDLCREIINRLEGNDDPALIVEPFAIVMEADLVLQPELLIYQQKDYLTLNQARTESKMYTASVAGVRLIGYDLAEKKAFSKTATLVYDYEQANVGEASYLARKCMDKTLKDAGVKERVAKAAESIQK